MTGLSTMVFFLTAAGSDEMARAQTATNVAATTNVISGPTLPAPVSAVQSNQIPTDEDDAVSNSPAQEITEIPPPQTPVPPTSAASHQSQTNAAAAVKIPTPPSPVPPPPPVRAAEPAPEAATIDFEFQGAPVNAILEWYARLTNRSIISAPNLAGVINFRSQTKLTRTDALQALDSVLAINNIAAIPLGEKFLKVVQITSAKTEGLPFGRVTAPADTLGTQIIPLKFADAAEVVAVLQPYLHPYGQLVALQKSNSILISETAANIKQMLEIVSYVDQPSMLRMEMHSYVLAHAKAADVMARLQSIIQGAEQAGGHAAVSGQPGQPAQPAGLIRRPTQPGQPGAPADEESVVEGKVIMAADERTNKIFILTRPSNFGFFNKLIAELDAKVEPDVVMKVIELNYATAEDIASLLNSLITGSSPAASTHHTTGSSSTTSTGARPPAIPPPPSSGGSAGSGTDTGFLQYAEGVHILPDPRTNSLLVMATKEDMVRIEQLVRSMDTSVAQVQI